MPSPADLPGVEPSFVEWVLIEMAKYLQQYFRRKIEASLRCASCSLEPRFGLRPHQGLLTAHNNIIDWPPINFINREDSIFD